MTRLCLPLSDAFRRREAELLPLAGALEVKDASAPIPEGAGGRPILYDTGIPLSDPDAPERLDRAGAWAFIEGHGVAQVIMDLGPAPAAYRTESNRNGFPRYIPTAPPRPAGELIETCRRNAARLRARIPARLAVENLNYFPTGAYEVVCEPDFIRDVLETCDLDLALDLPHAIISAGNLHLPVPAYLEQLPLPRVTTIHVSRAAVINGILEDAHGCPEAEDDALVASLVHRCVPQFVTLEVYRDEGQLVATVQRLAALLAEAPTGTPGGRRP